MTACCREADCRRTQPYKIRLAPFSGRWVLITRYKSRADNLIVAQEKHDIHDELVAALLEAGWIPPPPIPDDEEGEAS